MSGLKLIVKQIDRVWFDIDSKALIQIDSLRIDIDSKVLLR